MLNLFLIEFEIGNTSSEERSLHLSWETMQSHTHYLFLTQSSVYLLAKKERKEKQEKEKIQLRCLTTMPYGSPAKTS